jgi:hypothetical protein
MKNLLKRFGVVLCIPATFVIINIKSRWNININIDTEKASQFSLPSACSIFCDFNKKGTISAINIHGNENRENRIDRREKKKG